MYCDFGTLPSELKDEISMRDVVRSPVIIVPGDKSPTPKRHPDWHFEIGIEWIQDNITKTIAVDRLIAKYHSELLGVTTEDKP
jgi:hypothetical protein